MSRHILPFLGQRQYLHGTTLLNALLDAAQARGMCLPGASFSFKAVRPLFTNHVEFFLPSQPEEENAADVLLHCAGQCLAVRGLPPVTPAQREPFDEAALCAAATFDTSAEGGVRWDLPSGAGVVRSAVLLFKEYLLRTQTVTQQGQWAFLRMDGLLPCPEHGLMRLVPLHGRIPGLAMAHILQQNNCRDMKTEDSNAASQWATLYFAWRELTGEK